MEGRIPIEVEVRSDPAGANAYVVSERLWRTAGARYYESSLRNGRLDPWFEAYRIKSDVTPVRTSTSMGILHLIVAKDGDFEHSEVVPSHSGPKPESEIYSFTVRIPKRDPVDPKPEVQVRS